MDELHAQTGYLWRSIKAGCRPIVFNVIPRLAFQGGWQYNRRMAFRWKHKILSPAIRICSLCASCLHQHAVSATVNLKVPLHRGS